VASESQPLAYDLFCGYGGWADGLLAHGWRVVGYDNEPKCATRYPGEFVLQDVSTIAGSRLAGAGIIVASPPCQRFSEARASRKHDPATEDDLGLLKQAVRVIREAQPRYWVIENVRGAVPLFSSVLGAPRYSKRPFYLWGRFPPFLVGQSNLRKMGWYYRPDKGKWFQTPGKRDPRERARLPLNLTSPIAEACLP